jgi:hypothetical protein
VESRGTAVLLALMLLAGAAAAVLVVEGLGAPDGRAASDFQQLTGGIGFGPAVDLSGCAFGFDPRLDGACSEDCGPLPGGACFCPRHAGSVWCYSPLNRDQPGLWAEDADAPLP